MTDFNYFRNVGIAIAEYFRTHTALGEKEAVHCIQKSALIELLKEFDEELSRNINELSQVDDKEILKARIGELKEIISSKLIAKNKMLEALILHLSEFLKEIELLSKNNLLDKDHKNAFKFVIEEYSIRVEESDYIGSANKMMDLVKYILKIIETEELTNKKQSEIGSLIREILYRDIRTRENIIEKETSREGNQIEQDENLVFVVMAIEDDMEPIFEGMVEAGNQFGLDVKRVKDEEGDYKITDKMIELIHKAYLIIVDVTYEKPNVYFELGYARGIGKTVIETARKGTKLHFDIKDWKRKFYTDSREIEKYLLERFEFELKRRNE